MPDESAIAWLMQGPPWLRYAVETQLLDWTSDEEAALSDPPLRPVIARLKDPVAGIGALAAGRLSYATTGTAFWDLFFLADVGLSASGLGIRDEIEGVLDRQLRNGSFSFGSDPSYYCRSAIILSSVARLGYRDDPRISRFIGHFLDEQRLDGGWHCLDSEDACPMDNLNILMLLGQYEAYREYARLGGALDLLLTHWSRRGDWRPAGFGMGKRFLKLEYPAVRYGILRVLDVLSLFPYAIRSSEFASMLAYVEQKAVDGRYYAESVPTGYPGLDFAQTATPSRWISFIVERVRARAAGRAH